MVRGAPAEIAAAPRCSAPARSAPREAPRSPHAAPRSPRPWPAGRAAPAHSWPRSLPASHGSASPPLWWRRCSPFWRCHCRAELLRRPTLVEPVLRANRAEVVPRQTTQRQVDPCVAQDAAHSAPRPPPFLTGHAASPVRREQHGGHILRTTQLRGRRVAIPASRGRACARTLVARLTESAHLPPVRRACTSAPRLQDARGASRPALTARSRHSCVIRRRACLPDPQLMRWPPRSPLCTHCCLSCSSKRLLAQQQQVLRGWK